MRPLAILLSLVTIVAATPLEESIEDLGAAIAARLAVATARTELKALGRAGAAVDAYIAAAKPDRKARALLVKAAKSITKSRTPDASIAADGQTAIQEELGAVAAAVRAEAVAKRNEPAIALEEGGAKTYAKTGALIDKGDAILGSLATVADYAKADALANKAIVLYEKAVATADKFLALN